MKICLLIPTDEDYLLGVADMTGELMKLAINSVAHGEHEKTFAFLDTLRSIQEEMKTLPLYSMGELKKKMSTLNASLEKVEKVCYEIKVRGSEYPKEMLIDINSIHLLTSPPNDQSNEYNED